MGDVTFDFSNYRVLVTGGSSGIGLAVATAFAEAEADVIVTGRRAAAGDYDVDLSKFDYRQAEMADKESLDDLIAGIDQLDVLVNNAGTSLVERDEWNPDTFTEALTTNLSSGFRLSVGFKPLLAQSPAVGGGSIVNCSSMSSMRAVPIVPGYGASKAGVTQMTLNMGVAWAEENVRVNCVAPGLIATNLTAAMRLDGMEEIADAELARVPMARWGLPEEVAPTFLFLASPAARFITGQTFCVDGGYSVK